MFDVFEFVGNGQDYYQHIAHVKLRILFLQSADVYKQPNGRWECASSICLIFFKLRLKKWWYDTNKCHVSEFTSKAFLTSGGLLV